MQALTGADIEARGRLQPLVARSLAKRIRRLHGHASNMLRHSIGLPMCTVPIASLRSNRKSIARARRYLLRHYRTHRMNSRPRLHFSLGPVEDPMVDMRDDAFYVDTGFTKAALREAVRHLTLLPAKISHKSTAAALTCMLVRWRHPARWELTCNVLRWQRSTTLRVYWDTVTILHEHYGLLARTIDILRVRPLLEEWTGMLQHKLGCQADICYFQDGKCVPTARPGTGSYAQLIARRAGTPVNLVQQNAWGGMYHAHGVKAQHLLQADGMLSCYTYETVRQHDATVDVRSGIKYLLQQMDVGGDPNRPCKRCTDAAYREDRNTVCRHTAAQLRTIATNLGAAAADGVQRQDSKNMSARMGVEMSFNSISGVFPMVDYKRTIRLLEGGKNNRVRLMQTWACMVIMKNLYVCHMGSPESVLYNIQPPSIGEYLHNANHGLLVDPLRDLNNQNIV